MLISDFDYILPESKIAKFAPEVRGETKLLVFNRENDTALDNWYKNLDEYFEPGDLVVLNNTKVIPARIRGVKSEKLNSADNAKIVELLLTEFHSDAQDKLTEQIWNVVYRGNLRDGDKIDFSNGENAEIVEILIGGIAKCKFSCNPVALAMEIGEMPIPPYLKRESTVDDYERYQTEFGEVIGSVAAPTASLNFTNELKEKFIKKGVRVEYLTLHVGLGTFMPVRTDRVDEHVMHAEYFEIPDQTVQAIQETKRAGGKVLAVGTTVCRTLEHAAEELRNWKLASNTKNNSITGEADIFIYPGYEFKMVDALLTNFHAPRSTPLLLVSAFSGFDLLMEGYQHALKSDYQFLSFGDSCLII